MMPKRIVRTREMVESRWLVAVWDICVGIVTGKEREE
jgi:hypothetical protein